MEQILVDFAILKTVGSSSTVFAAVALKNDVSTFLQELQMLGFDPDIITIESWSIANLLKKAVLPGFESKPVCVVNIGASQTNINIYVGAEPVLTHVSTCGGDQITQAIANSYHLSLADAEKAKVDGAFLLTQTHIKNHTDITAEQKQFSSVLEDAIAPLLRELKQVLIAYRTQHQHLAKAIFVTGGSSLIPNLPLFFEEHLQVPVFSYSYISQLVGQTLQLSESSEARITGAVGLALTAIKPEKNSSINLRKDEFEKSGGMGTVSLKNYRKFFVYAAAVLAFIYVNLIVQYAVLSSRSEKQEASLERSIKSVLGAVSPSVLRTYASSPSSLKTAVEKELAKYKDTQTVTVKTGISALDLLNKVSATMGSDMVLDSNLFQVKDGSFKLAGTIDTTANVTKVGHALEESRLLADIIKGKVEEERQKKDQPKTVRFDFTAKVAEVAPSNVKTK